jgi:hypothetical protein
MWIATPPPCCEAGAGALTVRYPAGLPPVGCFVCSVPKCEGLGVSPAARGPGFARSRATNNVAQLRRATPADWCAGGLQRARRVSSERPPGLSRPCGRESLTRSEVGPVCLAGLRCVCMVQRLRSLRLAITYARKLAPAGRSPAAGFCGGQCPPHPHVSRGRWCRGGVRRRGAACRAGGRPQRRGARANARLTRRRNTRAPRAGMSCIALSHRCTDVPYPTAPPGAEAARPHTFAAIARDVQ